MYALFLSRKLSVSGSIPSLPLKDNARRDPYLFLSWVSMMTATLPLDLLITYNAGLGGLFGLRAPSKQDMQHSLHLNSPTS